ncbi:hypothetical protein EVJ50_06725 [Synechococcus sp. RSCCF101]|uniref:hypothetical protein n=1 Tax=Synechococcus sp. RSCCF101 TaxID=2511069 RepID=UPI0012467459|nr:hypothetical protein [Synechococcus sp. RSCCF101]QEY31974.1 hypothetical protein EVJ50_06725 [Synechococcus sp. RSCCF101]
MSARRHPGRLPGLVAGALVAACSGAMATPLLVAAAPGSTGHPCNVEVNENQSVDAGTCTVYTYESYVGADGKTYRRAGPRNTPADYVPRHARLTSEGSV